MIKCIVVDDEMPAREELKYLLGEFEGIKIVGEAFHGREAIELTKVLEPDLIFLDISMPELNGLEVAQLLKKEVEKPPMIVFVTAYDQFAVEAFEVNAVDYLLKPIEKERLKKTIQRVGRAFEAPQDDYRKKIDTLMNYFQEDPVKKVNKISVYHRDRLIPLAPLEIIYITAEGRGTTILSTKGRFESTTTLSQLEDKLCANSFFRCHKSYLINLDYIEEITPWFNSTFMVKLRGIEEGIPVSRSQAKIFKKLMDIN